MIVVIAGGVGAARLLRGVREVVPDDQLTVVVNVGDDCDLHGLHISPDVDTVVYTLAGAIDPERGWGLAGESWRAMDALRRYEPAGAVTWFNLGDADLATHLWRTGRLREGAGLARVCAELVAAWGLGFTLLPVTEDRLRTVLDTEAGRLGFQEYFVRHRHAVTVHGVHFDGARSARPTPGVLEAIEAADAVLIAPSNPIVSVGPVLAVPGVADALRARRDVTTAISPLVGGAALKGPADRMMRELGHRADAAGVAEYYREVISALIIDEIDASLAADVRAVGVEPIVADTLMHRPGVAADLARRALARR